MIEREVWKIGRAGSLGRLKLLPETLPALGPGQVRVGVRAVGLNFADVFACLGLYSATPSGEFIPGLEFAGEVEEVSRRQGERSPWKRGDRVMGVIRFGAFASRVHVDDRLLQPLPPQWSFAEGAGFAVQALTAWYALKELGGLRQGQLVLVHSAAGGVGLNALSILQRFEGRVIATVGQESKAAFLIEHRGLSADQIIIRDPGSFPQRLDEALKKAHEEGLDIVLDAVAGPYFKPAYRRIRPGGRLVLFGAASMMPAGNRPNYARLALKYLRRPRLDPLNMISENKSLMAFNLIWLWDRIDLLRRLYTDLSQELKAPPYIGRRFPFSQAVRALRYLQSGHSVGKVVLELARISHPQS
ncbi:MAG: zinc-binding dehydrogenase [Acidobacteriota bacterium]